MMKKFGVRLGEARIPPVEKEDWTEGQRAYLEPHEKAGRLLNVFKTAAHHPDLARSFDAFAFGYINRESSTLPPRHRELLILRIGWLCRSEYEWAVHSRIARSIGFTDDELVRITQGPDAPKWTPFEATLLRAVDELHRDAFITDATWGALSSEYDTRQIMDLVFTVGTYNTVSMALNCWGVQLDEGFTGFPEAE
jgi:4-carboxymuconolactone decarboxylase